MLILMSLPSTLTTMPSPAHATATFHRFSDLPTELRLDIWEAAIVEAFARPVKISHSLSAPYLQTDQPPAILHVNTEARNHAKRSVVLSGIALKNGTLSFYHRPGRQNLYFDTAHKPRVGSTEQHCSCARKNPSGTRCRCRDAHMKPCRCPLAHIASEQRYFLEYFKPWGNMTVDRVAIRLYAPTGYCCGARSLTTCKGGFQISKSLPSCWNTTFPMSDRRGYFIGGRWCRGNERNDGRVSCTFSNSIYASEIPHRLSG